MYVCDLNDYVHYVALYLDKDTGQYYVLFEDSVFVEDPETGYGTERLTGEILRQEFPEEKGLSHHIRTLLRRRRSLKKQQKQNE
jgi:hypothetical protein